MGALLLLRCQLDRYRQGVTQEAVRCGTQQRQVAAGGTPGGRQGIWRQQVQPCLHTDSKGKQT
jgi:hypothetical protein